MEVLEVEIREEVIGEIANLPPLTRRPPFPAFAVVLGPPPVRGQALGWPGDPPQPGGRRGAGRGRTHQ
jgi:hypothetical protein